MLLSASEVLSKPRRVPGPALTMTGDTPVSSAKEPLPPQHGAASASKKNTDKQTGPFSKSAMQQSTKEKEKKKSKGESSLK